MSELLPKIEPKDLSPKEDVQINVNPDFNHALNLNNSRFQKLEKIKPFIFLKTYHQLFEKLENEKKKIEEQISKYQKAEKTIQQVLPKSFFEQRFMKIKSIRIN